MNKQNITIKYWTFAIFIFIMILITSCDNPTKVKSYSVSGTVYANDNFGIENATILIYNYLLLDDATNSFKELYPNHGSDLRFYNLFDHRNSIPIAQTLSSNDGIFSFQNIPKGVYIIVAYKSGYGFKYLNNIEVSENISGLRINILPITDLPATISSNIDLVDNRFYSITSDLIILTGVTVNIGRNVTLVVSPLKKIEIYGTLEISEEGSLLVMSMDSLYTHSQQYSSIGKFDSITFINQESKVIRNIKVINSELGIRFSYSSNITMCNSYVSAEYQCVAVSSSPNFHLLQCSITNATDTMRGAVFIENSSGSVIECCHIFNNKIGAQISYSQNVQVYNNYFTSNSIYDFGFAQDGVGTVEYNTFKNSQTAIYNYRGQMFANYNDIEAVTGIFAERVNAWFSAKFNNLKCSKYGIKSRCMFYNSPIMHLEGTHNYWYTYNIDEIEELIYDRNDDSESDENYYLLVTVVDYLPISSTPNRAGIHNQ